MERKDLLIALEEIQQDRYDNSKLIYLSDNDLMKLFINEAIEIINLNVKERVRLSDENKQLKKTVYFYEL